MKPRYFESKTGHFVIEHEKGSVRLTLGNGLKEQVIKLSRNNAIALGEAIKKAGELLPAPPVLGGEVKS